MMWNADFEIASIVLQAVFIVFFLVKKHLPTRQNRLYIICSLLSFSIVSLDVITAFTNSYATQFSSGLLLFLNTAYFTVVPMLSLMFFVYILALAGEFSFVKTPTFIMFCAPAFLSLMLAISSGFTGFLFYFDNNMVYHQGPCYVIEFASNAIYLILALVFVIIYRRKISALERNCILGFCCMTMIGVVLQASYFRWVLLTNAMTALALVILYLSLQNPDIYIDKETGIFNIYAFSTLTEELVSAGKSFSVIYFAINDMKNMEALYGVENMNVVVAEITEYLKKVFAGKWIYRFDVGKFIIQEPGEGDFAEIERALRNRFERPFKGVTGDIAVDLDVVIVPYWHMPQSVAKIINLKDFGERVAIERGGGVTVEIDDTIIDRMERNLAVDRALERAILENSIQVYFQPIFSTTTGKITSCEALSRLFDDDIGFIPPDEFISKAEENGSIIRIGEQIFDKICQFIKEREPQRYGIENVHVNLSPVQCMLEDLPETIIRIAGRHGVPLSMIDLEITETAAVAQNKVIINNMETLIAASCTFSLDDYGTGFSNTATIVSLPFASVKIDKSLLWSHYSGKSSVLPDLVQMFHNQKLMLIVEGVETQEMAEGLAAMGCQYLQGFYFSKPLPQREFMSYIRTFDGNTSKKA